MPNTVEIIVKFGDEATVDLIRLMAAELQYCYVHLDELAVAAGQPKWHRNFDLIDKIGTWGESMRVVTEDA